MKNIIFTSLFCLLVSHQILSQIQTRIINSEQLSEIKRFTSKHQSPIIELPPVLSTIKTYMKEDSIQRYDNVPFRFGVGIDVEITLENSGIWEEVIGGRVWKVLIRSNGAHSINLRFDSITISDESKLYISNESSSMIYGPIDNTNYYNRSGKLYSDLIQGETVLVELFVPNNAGKTNSLRIGKVIHGYRDLFYESGGFGESDSCNIDVACPLGNGWEQEEKGVAMIILDNGTRVCTGSLLNNSCSALTPNFLTAFHCVDVDGNKTLSSSEINAAEDWFFRFQYQSPSCNGPDDTNYLSYPGASFKAAWKETDFALLELFQLPADGSLLGWDRSGNIPNSITTIHHPKGDVMKISQDNESPSLFTYYNTTNSHLFVDDWEYGSTTTGSSGAPHFDENGRVVAQTHAGDGYDDCDPDKGTYVGRFLVSWGKDNNGNYLPGRDASNSLAPYLDPINTGAVTTNTIPSETPLISGTDLVCNSNTSFQIVNYPTGTDVSWSVSPASLFAIDSSTDTIFTTRAASSSSAGNGTITAIISGACGTLYTLTHDVQVGSIQPGPIDVEMGAPPRRFTAIIEPVEYATSYNWYLDGVLNNYYHTTLAIFNQSSPYCGNSYYVGVRAINSCGASAQTYTVAYESPCFFRLTINPNPSNNETIIQVIDELELQDSAVEWDLEIYDEKLRYSYRKEGIKNLKITFTTSDLNPGIYIVKAYYKGEVLNNKIVVP